MSEHTIDLNRLPHHHSRGLVALATELGWLLRQKSNGGVVIAAPNNPSITMEIAPVRQFNEAKLRTMARKVMRYGDPMKLAVLHAANDKDTVGYDSANNGLHKLLQELNRTGGKIVVEQPEPPAPVAPAPKPVKAEPVKAEPVILAVGQWLARKNSLSSGGGRVYQSHAVLERNWSDGSTDYLCAWPDCDYSAATPYSVSTHYGRSKSHSLTGTQTPLLEVPVYEPSGIRHGASTEARARRLARELLAAQAALGTDWSWDGPGQVEALALAVVRARDEGKDDHELPGPLSNEQVLERIRRLVDDGSYLVALEQQQQQKDEIEALHRDLEESLGAQQAEANARVQAEARAVEAEDNWTALRELINRPTGNGDAVND